MNKDKLVNQKYGKIESSQNKPTYGTRLSLHILTQSYRGLARFEQHFGMDKSAPNG